MRHLSVKLLKALPDKLWPTIIIPLSSDMDQYRKELTLLPSLTKESCTFREGCCGLIGGIVDALTLLKPPIGTCVSFRAGSPAGLRQRYCWQSKNSSQIEAKTIHHSQTRSQSIQDHHAKAAVPGEQTLRVRNVLVATSLWHTVESCREIDLECLERPVR